MPGGELRVTRSAQPISAGIMRHALGAFLTALDITESAQIEIITAVGEALANTVEHAYTGADVGDIEMFARTENPRTLRVDIVDRGKFVDRTRHIDRGFGLKIMRAAAQSMSIEKEGGTSIRMAFNLSS